MKRYWRPLKDRLRQNRSIGAPAISFYASLDKLRRPRALWSEWRLTDRVSRPDRKSSSRIRLTDRGVARIFGEGANPTMETFASLSLRWFGQIGK